MFYTVIVMYLANIKTMKVCGELMCSAYELCMPHDLQCYPCDSYCDDKSRNFDKFYCQRQCQGKRSLPFYSSYCSLLIIIIKRRQNQKLVI